MRIVNTLKKTQGLSVGELGERLKLSYMGVKQHCDELERRGYVDTWRRPKPVGRPEMVSANAQSAHFFSSATNATTIEILHAANRLYGHAAGEKLLYSVFALKTEEYMGKLRGTTVLEVAESWPRFATRKVICPNFPTKTQLRSSSITRRFLICWKLSLVRRLEREMVERILGVRVEREEEMASGLYRCRFIFRP